jgi:hypothetical protein
MKIRIVNVNDPLTFVVADGEPLELDHVRVVLQPGQYIVLPDEEDELSLEDIKQVVAKVASSPEVTATLDAMPIEQPDPVCACGRTSEGLCSKCGQFIDTSEQAKRDASLTVLDYDDARFRKFFTTPFEQYKEHVGKAFVVVKQTRPLKLATETEDGEDDMYLIKLETGEEIEAFGHEVCFLNYENCK